MGKLYVLLLLFSCCTNVVLLEMLIKDAPGSGNLVTFFQFLFIAVEGFIFTSKFGTVTPVIPIRNYVILVTLFFAVSVSNNWALNYNISMPLHMIIKSGSLVTNMLLAIIILKRRYSLLKYLSVLMVSVGIFFATWASQNLKESSESHQNVSSIIGIALLSFSLLVSSWLGIYQETLFRRFGRHPREALFYSHALAIPGFAMLFQDILQILPLLTQSEPLQLTLQLSIPKLWLCLLANVLTQYICVRSVFSLAANYSSLTVTMVITFRKFVSLLFSILYFRNPFTITHWMATGLVFAGTLLFAKG